MRSGVVPVAGKGLRFGEISKRYPKCILPYKNKPIIVHTIEYLFDVVKCNEVILVVNYGRDKIREIVEAYFYGDDRIRFCVYEADDGVAGSVLAGMKECSPSSKEVLIALGDMVIQSDIREKTNFNNDFLSVTDICGIDPSRWCMVYTDTATGKTCFSDKSPEKILTSRPLNGLYFITDKDRFIDIGEKQKHHHRTSEWQLSEILSAYSDKWDIHSVSVLDFGTLPEYLENRDISISREFNSVVIQEDQVVKSSSKNPEKIYKEYCWYQFAPRTIKRYLPSVYDADFTFTSRSAKYSMERIDYLTLREIYLFDSNDLNLWSEIIRHLLDVVQTFISSTKRYSPLSEEFFKTVLKRTEERLSSVGKHFPDGFVDRYEEQFRSPGHSLHFYHGDLCFSNVFYDISTKRIKLIDPRGEYYGSYKYDLAKLTHSFLGLYDLVDSEMYFITKENKIRLYSKNKKDLALFWLRMLETTFGNRITEQVLTLTSSLFFSMIPLHYHNKINQELYYKIGSFIWNKDFSFLDENWEF